MIGALIKTPIDTWPEAAVVGVLILGVAWVLVAIIAGWGE